MKNIIFKIFTLAVLAVCVYGCKTDDMEYHDPEVSAADALYTPTDNQKLTLSSQAGATTMFQWSAGHAQDGQAVFYEVVFYKESDTENPVYRVGAMQSGQTYASIPHVEINKAAGRAGIPTGEEGKMFWTVVSWRGLKSAICPQKNEITVTRLKGFEVLPENVYITGDASEAGTEIANAIQMKKIEDGKFEIYTKLSNQGTYKFVDRLTDDAEVYYIQGTDNLLDADNNESSSVADESVYRINLDFTSKYAKLEKIERVEFNMCTPKQVIEMPYIGGGVWKVDNIQPDFKTEWDDDRYFYFMYVDGVKYKLGNKDKDSGNPGATSGAYFNIGYIGLDDNQWDYCFKFTSEMRSDGTSNPGSVVVDMILYMNISKGYTNEIVKKY